MFDGRVEAFKDGRSWPIGTTREVDWIVNGTTEGLSITVAIPPVFEAYASFYEPDGVAILAHERAVVNRLAELTPPSRGGWATSTLAPTASSSTRSQGVSLLGLALRAGRCRPRTSTQLANGAYASGNGVLPDLFFPTIDPGWFRLCGTTPGPVSADQQLSSRPFTTIH